MLVPPEACSVVREALPAVRLEDRRVRHRDQRRVGHQLARAREHVEARARAHAALQRALARAADHRPVRERVGEREAELDDVGAAVDGRLRELRRLRLGHQVDDERLAAINVEVEQHFGEVLVAAAGEADEDQLRVELAGARERVRRLERRDDALGAREVAERGERLLVGRADVLRAAAVAEERVLRADAGIVEAGRDRVRVGDLPVLVGEDRRARAVQHAGPAGAERRRAGRLDADEAHVRVVEEAVEDADRVRAAADARDDRLGQPPLRRRASARAPRGRSPTAARRRARGTARGRRTSRSGSASSRRS